MQKQQPKFYEILVECYRKFGAYKEKLISFLQKGKEGADKIKAMMEGYRNNPPKEIGGLRFLNQKTTQKRTDFPFGEPIRGNKFACG